MVRPSDWTRRQVGKLARRNQAFRIKARAVRSSHKGRFAAEVAHGLQDRGAELLGAAGGGRLEKLFDGPQTEFLAALFVVALAFDHSARDEQQSRTFFHGHSGSVGSGVGKESEGQASGGEFGDSFGIAEKAGRMSGVGVAEGSELLVVAGDEGGARANAAGSLDNRAIDAKAKFSHGLGFVDVGAREELSTKVAEDLLSCGQDAAVILAAPGHVEQAKQNALGADADGVVEISGNAFSHKDGCDVSALDLGKHGRDGLDGRCDIRDAGVKERTHGEQAPSETSTGTGSGQTVRSRSRVGVRIHLSVSWPFSSSSRYFAIRDTSSLPSSQARSAASNAS